MTRNKEGKVKLMGQVIIWFYRENGLLARVNRIRLGSRWDKVGIEIDGQLTIVDRHRGVISVSKEYLWMKYSKSTFTFLPVPELRNGIVFLSQQYNKQEDTTIYKSHFNRFRNWRDDRKWSGVELTAEVLSHSGIDLDLPENRVTPSDLWNALPIIGFNSTSLR